MKRVGLECLDVVEIMIKVEVAVRGPVSAEEDAGARDEPLEVGEGRGEDSPELRQGV